MPTKKSGWRSVAKANNVSYLYPIPHPIDDGWTDLVALNVQSSAVGEKDLAVSAALLGNTQPCRNRNRRVTSAAISIFKSAATKI